MIRRFAAVSVLGSAAVLGYLGVRRLGEWIDAPLRALPAPTEDSRATTGITDRSMIPVPRDEVCTSELEAPA